MGALNLGNDCLRPSRDDQFIIVFLPAIIGNALAGTIYGLDPFSQKESYPTLPRPVPCLQEKRFLLKEACYVFMEKTRRIEWVIFLAKDVHGQPAVVLPDARGCRISGRPIPNDDDVLNVLHCGKILGDDKKNLLG